MADSADIPSPSGRAILAVDDEAAVVAALARQLRRWGYEVTTSIGAGPAVEMLRTREFALILSDNSMPGMRGLEFLSVAMNLHPMTRRILVTAFTDKDQAIEAFNHGILHRYVQKPWDEDALRSLVGEEVDAYERAKRELHALSELQDALRRRTGLVAEAAQLLRRAEQELSGSMDNPLLDRKLAVILVGDVVGFSRLMGHDHEHTLRTLTACREAIVTLLRQYHGRLVNAVGDSILAEFPSSIDAVACAMDIQTELDNRNAEVPEERRMRLRIGINIGDVLVKGGDLFGDGVNVAARLQSLAVPGGICISESVYRQVKMRLPYEVESLGSQQLKNIADPVHVYQVLPLSSRKEKAR